MPSAAKLLLALLPTSRVCLQGPAASSMSLLCVHTAVAAMRACIMCCHLLC